MNILRRLSRRMSVGRIALRNMVRHSGRSLLLILIITVAVGVVMTLDMVVYSAQRDLEKRTDEYGPNIVVVPRADELPLSYGGVDLGLSRMTRNHCMRAMQRRSVPSRTGKTSTG